MYGNILGFGVTRKVSEDTTIRGYISIWSTVESLGYDKWAPIERRGARGLLQRDRPLGHGHRRQDARLARAHVVRDRHALRPRLRRRPAVHRRARARLRSHRHRRALSRLRREHLATRRRAWAACSCTWASSIRSCSPRPRTTGRTRASCARRARSRFDRPIGDRPDQVRGRRALSAGVAHRDGHLPVTELITTAVWGASGGAARRGRAGSRRPLRLPRQGPRPLLRAADVRRRPRTIRPTHELRTFTGFYGQGALVFGRVQLRGGFGMSLVDQTAIRQDRRQRSA